MYFSLTKFYMVQKFKCTMLNVSFNCMDDSRNLWYYFWELFICQWSSQFGIYLCFNGCVPVLELLTASSSAHLICLVIFIIYRVPRV